ncbi:MAG: tRNA (adenosine(37)-N6)-threonylcarbamoyltransferase complex transferase subunit TsaD [Saprospiraceae bacterium]
MQMNTVLAVEPCILAIESSCDDTSAAVWRHGKLLSNVVASQLMHDKTGGIVPEVASRAHQQVIIPVVKRALEEADVDPKELDAVAVTRGPGLMGSLVVGVAFAKTYAAGLGIPLIEVHHMEAHVLAHFATEYKPTFPFLCLTVSGGHTQLLVVKGPFSYEEIGRTLDDAAGEAFDKSGKLLGLPYPAGPHIDRLAKEGNPKFEFSKQNLDGFDYSYSGLKTSILYFLQKEVRKNPDFIEENLNDLAASIQHSIVESLLIKAEAALHETGLKQLALAGGVSANSGLREASKALTDRLGIKLYTTPIRLSTDNAGMIAAAASFAYAEGRFAEDTLAPAARFAMST